MSQTYQIDKLVDEQKFGRFNLLLLFWCFLAMFSDGFDIAALASAAPELARTWQLRPGSFGPALSASLFGVLFGAPLLGYVGDRYGRRTAIVLGCVIYGLGTLATVWARNLDDVIVLRFLTGIGIGGLMPNTISLTSELSPKRLRAMLVVLMFTGITLGSGMPGNIQAWLIPQYGWKVMFLIGGILPLVIAVCLKFTLPESVKYLARRPARRAELLSTVRRLRPDLSIPDDAQFTTAAEPEVSGSGLKQIYAGVLAFVTPLLWVCFATALMANFFLNSWLPLIFENNGLTPQQAGLATSLYHYGGTLGGILVALVLGRYGFLVVALLFLLAAPAIAAIGLQGISWGVMATMGGVAGFCVLGAQFGNNASSGLIYPTAYRSRGVGWALGIGRFGSILGPLVGGALIEMKLPLQQLFLLAGAPMLLGTLAMTLIARIAYVKLGGTQLDDLHPDSTHASSSATSAIAAPGPMK